MSNALGKDFNKIWVKEGLGLAGILPTNQMGIRPGAVGAWDNNGNFNVKAHLDKNWGIELPPVKELAILEKLSFSSKTTSVEYFEVDGKGKLTEVQTLPTDGTFSAEMKYNFEDDNSITVANSNVVQSGWEDVAFLEKAWNDVLYKHANSFTTDRDLYFDAWHYRVVYQVYTATDYLMTASPSSSSKFTLSGTAGELSALEGGEVTGKIGVTSTVTGDLSASGYQGEKSVVAMNLGAFETWSIHGQKNHEFYQGMNSI